MQPDAFATGFCGVFAAPSAGFSAALVGAVAFAAGYAVGATVLRQECGALRKAHGRVLFQVAGRTRKPFLEKKRALLWMRCVRGVVAANGLPFGATFAEVAFRFPSRSAFDPGRFFRPAIVAMLPAQRATRCVG